MIENHMVLPNKTLEVNELRSAREHLETHATALAEIIDALNPSDPRLTKTERNEVATFLDVMAGRLLDVQTELDVISSDLDYAESRGRRDE